MPPAPGVGEFALSRRRFLGALTALAGAGLVPTLAACGTDQPAPATASPIAVAPTPSPTPAPLTSNPAYSALRELQALLRASPEHLRQRAEEVAATRDLDAIAEFVRTEIAVLPSAPGRDPLTDSPFGARGTLRAGAGTLRDRVELAAWMLERAGIAFTRAQMTRPDQLDQATLYAARNRQLETDVDRIAAIAASAGFPIEVPSAEVDPAPFTQEIDGLVDRLWGLVPADLRSAMGEAVDLPASIPILQVDSAAGPAWVLAAGGDGVRRDPPPGLYPSLADSVSPPVEVVVEAVMRPPRGHFADTDVVRELVRGAWTSSEVAGRQLSVGFPQLGDPASLVFLPADPTAPRVATIRLMAIDDDGGDATPVVGEAIAGGTVLSGNDGSSPPTDGRQSVLVATEASRTAARTRVASLTGTADASAFPTIDLGVDLRDADGRPVEGLGAQDLDVQEGGVSLPFQLIANTRPLAPRVLVVWDGSGSVDEAWPNADDRQAFERSIAETLTTISGSTPIETQVVSLGGAAQPDLWAPPEAASLQAAMTAVTVSTSDVWKTSGEYIPRSGASVAVLVTDGVSTLEDPARIAGWKEDLAAAGVPVVVLPVGTTDNAAIDEIVARSAGERLDVKAPDFAEKLGAMVGDRAAAAAATTYRVHYSAPLDGPPTRNVSVAITGSAKSATATYEVPAEADRAVEPGVAGLYVTISIGGRSARRRLGGVPLSDRGEPTARPVQADIDRCRSALMGMHTIAFEPERPSSAQLIDDAITGLLSYEAVEAAWPPGSNDATLPSDEDAARVLTAVQDARWFPAPAVMMLNDPTPDLRVPRARDLGVVLYHVEPVAGSVRMATDVVPQFNRSLAMAGEDASRSTIRASVVASVREGWLAEDSAYGELADAELVAIRPFDGPPLDWPAQRERVVDDLLAEYSGWIRLVPRNPAGAAMWVIDPETGAATAVGGLGSGQGVKTCQGDDENTQALNLALTGISLACGVVGNATVIQTLICNGFTVYGVYALAKGSFTTPINLGFALNVAGAMLSVVPLTKGSGWGVNPKNWDPKSMANRAVSAALQAMLAVIAMGTWCD